ISFDGATFDIWGPLLNGARLVLAPEILKDMHNLGHYYQQHGVTVVWLTSALFSTMVREHLDRMSTLRVCVAGGDVVSSEYVRQYLTRYPSSQFINGYGPTENTTFSSCYVIDDSAAVKDALPIGSPITGSRCYVLDEGLEPVAVGVPGELYVGGQGLASHYEGRAGLTAERFIPHPFANSGERLYRTGDIVRWNSDGALEFLGRRDDQIKLRGFRVELGEVNSALEALPAVAQSHAVVVTDERDIKRLVAYVAVGSRAPTSGVGERALGDGTVSEDILLQALKQTLPPYMVPVKLILLAEFPLTPNGKVDRRALPEVDFSGQVQGYEAPANPLEETLCQLWSRVLGCDEVGRHDNFFQLGGDSILAIQILSGLQELGESLSMQALYEHQTVA
ncbi:non-ribosomal peptide synthetase, partial [Teredinibacter turnerae]